MASPRSIICRARATSPLCPEQGPEEVSRLMPRMLLDIQNRGQLSAGMTTFNPDRNQLIDTYKELGGVSEVFRLNHRGKYESLMSEYAGRAAIGHVRYATCGAEDRSYAQPFERHHLQKHKWFSFAFNGQLANYQELRRRPAGRRRQPSGPRDRYRNHHARDRPRAVGRPQPPAGRACGETSVRGSTGPIAWSSSTRLGDMLVARDPLGIKPLCYAMEGPLFAAASESVALSIWASRPRASNRSCRARRSRSPTGGWRYSTSPPARAGPTAFSSGFISPTWPARWTGAASICRERPWAKSWPGWKRCRSTRTRSSFPCPTRARRRPTPWPTG